MSPGRRGTAVTYSDQVEHAKLFWLTFGYRRYSLHVF